MKEAKKGEEYGYNLVYRAQVVSICQRGLKTRVQRVFEKKLFADWSILLFSFSDQNKKRTDLYSKKER